MQTYQFLEDLREYISDNIDDIKTCELFEVSEKASFPCVVIGVESSPLATNTVDSSRTIKYRNITITFQIFTKQMKTITNKYETLLKIKDEIETLIMNSKNYNGLTLNYDNELPNLNSDIARWKISYSAILDTTLYSIF